MEREDACFLMVQARHLVEESQNSEQYRVIKFYADWVVHPELTRSRVCLETLKDITRVIVDNWNPTGPDMTTQVSQVIGIPTLRRELTALFRENKLPLQTFEYFENWKGFVGFFIWLLIDKPIGFPEVARGWAQEIKDEMIAMPKPVDVWVESLTITGIKSHPHWVLQLAGEKQLRMVGLLDLGENRESFRDPG